MKKFILILLLISFIQNSYASIIEELDNPPEGAHQGQLLLGLLFAIGYPIGSAADAEKNFVKNSTYTFLESNTTKKLLVDHLTFSFGLMGEYMPFDYLGIHIRLHRTVVVQRTLFGSDYENTTRILYSDYSMLLGPALHLTNRKWWDISIVPLIGYSFGKYKATPVADALLNGYSGSTRRQANGLVVGAELNVTVYFNGGFFLTAGFNWLMNMPQLDRAYSGLYKLTNSQTGLDYSTGNKFTLHSFCFMLTAGYAFSN